MVVAYHSDRVRGSVRYTSYESSIIFSNDPVINNFMSKNRSIRAMNANSGATNDSEIANRIHTEDHYDCLSVIITDTI